MRYVSSGLGVTLETLTLKEYLPAFMFIRFLYILTLCSIDNVFKYC